MMPRLISFLLLLTLATACAVPPMDAVRDLAAIHTEDDWRPRSPAQMSVAPAYYFGDLTAVAERAGSYTVDDHRALEKEILERIATVDVGDPAESLEVSAWMMVALLQDDHAPARKRAAEILGRNAGNWIVGEQARLRSTNPEINLVGALRGLENAEDRVSFDLALSQIGSAEIPDAITGIRILTALGRKAIDFTYSSGDGDDRIFSTALGIVLMGLDQGRNDADAEVSETCVYWYDLLLPRAQEAAATR
ncbi:MAG: hypothetical protein ACPG31_03215 [Planctomycetota bacterium]